MTDFDLTRERGPGAGAAPKDAATVIVMRTRGEVGVEFFCVERSSKSPFMPGAIVFPGGKLDPSDASPSWCARVSSVRPHRATRDPFATSADHLRALAVAAARETLEEAAILLATPASTDAEANLLRTRLAAAPQTFRELVQEAGLTLDLSALVPFARWITPLAESRRFDTRFFVARCPHDQSGAIDQHETVSSFWASAAEVLRRFDAGEVTLFAPTHRTLELLATCSTEEEVLNLAAEQSLEPICPQLVPHEDETGSTMALVLPGDPAHTQADVRVAGHSRFVLRGGRWLPENASL